MNSGWEQRTEWLSKSFACRQVGQGKILWMLTFNLIQNLGKSMLCQWMDPMQAMIRIWCRKYYELLYLGCFLTAETIKSCDTPHAFHLQLSCCTNCSLHALLNSCLSLKRICQCVQGDKGASIMARIIVRGSIQNCFHKSQMSG